MADREASKHSGRARGSRFWAAAETAIEKIVDRAVLSLFVATVLSVGGSVLLDHFWKDQDEYPASADLAHVALAAPLFAVVVVLILEETQLHRERRREKQAAEFAALSSAREIMKQILPSIGSHSGALAKLMSYCGEGQSEVSRDSLVAVASELNKARYAPNPDKGRQVARTDITELLDEADAELKDLPKWDVDARKSQEMFDQLFELLAGLTEDQPRKTAAVILEAARSPLAPSPNKFSAITELSQAIGTLRDGGSATLGTVDQRIIATESARRERLRSSLEDLEKPNQRDLAWMSMIYSLLDD